MHIFSVLLVLLAISTQAVSFFNVSYSPVEQCGPFFVDVFGPFTPDLPLTLTVVPFLSEALSIPIPPGLWDEETLSGKITVPFLPIPVGSEFVASLDDANNQSLGLVSDVIAVQHSNNKSCLPQHHGSGQRLFSMHGGLSQCSRFNISFDPSKVLKFPSVRAFLPRSFSFIVNASNTPATTVEIGGHSDSSSDGDDDDNDKNSKNNKTSSGKDSKESESSDKDDDDSDDNNNNSDDSGNNGGNSNSSNGNGNSTDNSDDSKAHNITNKEYILNVIHGIQAVLLMDDGLGHRETSQLFTAGGTAGSPLSCFHFNSASNTTDDDPLPTPSAGGSTGGSDGGPGISSSESGHKLTKGDKVAITLSVLSAIAISISIAYILLRRRRFNKGRDDLFKTGSFVFTEDVDMGSSFATRIRTQMSRVLSLEGPGTEAVKRRYPSYRSYRDEKDGVSSYIPTSPIGSLNLPTTPRTSLVRSEKIVSWVPFTDGAILEQLSFFEKGQANSRTTRAARALPFVDVGKALPSIPNSQIRDSELPTSTIPRDSVVSRLIFGSGYVPSIRNERLAPPPPLPKPTSLVSSQRTTATPSYVESSLSGYQPSAPSTTNSQTLVIRKPQNNSGPDDTTELGTQPEPQRQKIFVSSPIRPDFVTDPSFANNTNNSNINGSGSGVTTTTGSFSLNSTGNSSGANGGSGSGGGPKFNADTNKNGFGFGGANTSSGTGIGKSLLGNLARKDPGRVSPFPTVPRREGRSRSGP